MVKQAKQVVSARVIRDRLSGRPTVEIFDGAQVLKQFNPDDKRLPVKDKTKTVVMGGLRWQIEWK